MRVRRHKLGLCVQQILTLSPSLTFKGLPSSDTACGAAACLAGASPSANSGGGFQPLLPHGIASTSSMLFAPPSSDVVVA